MDSDIPTTPEERLIPFLRNLADSIERKQLLPKQLEQIGDFFMTYNFQQQVEDIENDDDNDEDNDISDAFDREEIMKFFSLGWYVYTHLLRET